MANYDEAQRLGAKELELQSTDGDNYPYIKIRGGLYWDGSSWVKWTGFVPPTTVGNGQKTVTAAGTAEALAASTSIHSVTIKALAGNTNNVYVGDSSVDSTNGFVLDSGESISLDIDNLADVYIDTDTNGEGVSFIYVS